MSSPQSPIENAVQRGRMFWLPPGGTGNGIEASAWAELADLTHEEYEQVLAMLAHSGIGGYVAVPSGHYAHPREPVRYRLWVDSLQYHRAEDLLIELLHRMSHVRQI